MADSLLAGPSANPLDPANANNKRKQLLAMMMAQHGVPGSAGPGAIGGGDVGGISFLGGIRAIPRNRQGTNDTGFTQGSQVASQFLGGLGVGARQPSGPAGGVVAQYVGGSGGVGGGPQGSTNDPAAPAVAAANAAPVNAASAAPPTGMGGVSPTDPNAIHATDPGAPTQIAQSGYNPYTDPNAINSRGTGNAQRTPGNQSQSPTSIPQGMVPLGGGAYYNPSTGLVHTTTPGFSGQ